MENTKIINTQNIICHKSILCSECPFKMSYHDKWLRYKYCYNGKTRVKARRGK
jgi:hypothetical protein